MNAIALFETQDEANDFASVAPGDVLCKCSQDGHNHFFWRWFGPLPEGAKFVRHGEYHDTYEWRGVTLLTWP